MTNCVVYEQRGPVAWVTMNRPDVANAQTAAMTRAMDEAFRRAVDDDEIKVIVLAGSGKHFSGGHDIGTEQRDIHKDFERIATTWYPHEDKGGAENLFAREQELYLGMCQRWRELPKPMIASVQGACIAGGLMLAWCCDLIVCSEDAVFSDPVVRMGIPGVEYFAHVHELGSRRAREFLYTGARIDAREAEAWGMVNRVVGRDELVSSTQELAERIAKMPRFALALTKKAINQAENRMGRRDVMEATFGLHHLAHAHNALSSSDHLAGHDAKSMKDD